MLAFKINLLHSHCGEIPGILNNGIYFLSFSHLIKSTVSFNRIVKVRETRVTGIVSHILIGLSIFLLPYPMAYIPTAVLDGLFLYMAITSLNGNQMFERITLLFMEQVNLEI